MRTVFCRKYQTELEALPTPPFPGAKGQDIYEHVSAHAWQAWLAHQTLLINEKKLNLMDKTARQYLAEQMDKFFANETTDRIEGYIPPPPT